MTEIWKDIIGYEGLYQVSNLGRVRSLDRIIPKVTRWGTFTEHHHKGRVLKQHFDGLGHYLIVILRKDNESHTEQVHRLVGKAFLSCDDYSIEINHKDGCRTNNTVSNLEWCDRSYNLKHALNIGLIESQCKIRRSVHMVSDDGDVFDFPDMISCCNFFNHTKCWLGNYVKNHGNPCRYGKYTICVSERG